MNQIFPTQQYFCFHTNTCLYKPCNANRFIYETIFLGHIIIVVHLTNDLSVVIWIIKFGHFMDIRFLWIVPNRTASTSIKRPCLLIRYGLGIMIQRKLLSGVKEAKSCILFKMARMIWLQCNWKMIWSWT